MSLLGFIKGMVSPAKLLIGQTVYYNNKRWVLLDTGSYDRDGVARTVALYRNIIVDPRRRKHDMTETRRNVLVSDLQDPSEYDEEAALADDAAGVKEQGLLSRSKRW